MTPCYAITDISQFSFEISEWKIHLWEGVAGLPFDAAKAPPLLLDAGQLAQDAQDHAFKANLAVRF